MYLNSIDTQAIYSSTRLSYKSLELYVVEKQTGFIAYCIKLLSTIRRLYLVFNFVKLTATSENLILSDLKIGGLFLLHFFLNI